MLRRRVPRPPIPKPVETRPHIDALIRDARVTFLALLAFLAFVGVTVLGVEDADFFIPSRQTQLPLIGVTVPTGLFFYVSPLLILLLYAHLHHYLMRLWKALARLQATKPEEIEGRIDPWIGADFALRIIFGRIDWHSPLQSLTALVVFALIFLAAPVVLATMWYWGLAKHDEWMTVVMTGIPLFASVYISLTSLRRLRRARMEREGPEWGRWPRRIWALAFLALMSAGWLLTEGTFRQYEFALRVGLLGHGVNEVADAPWAPWDFWQPVSAQLQDVALTPLPPDWLARDAAEEKFRQTWCASQGWSNAVCGPGPLALDGQEQKDLFERDVTAARSHWCDSNRAPPAARACLDHIAEREKAYPAEWKFHREAALSALPKSAYGSAPDAQMGSPRAMWDLAMAADLRNVRLPRARMEKANLRFARMEGADLRGARIERSDLSDARLQRADLSEALMEGAFLSGARMDKSTRFAGAETHVAAASLVDFSMTDLSPDQIKSMFGDGSVSLPGCKAGESCWPGHWPENILDGVEFQDKWCAFQRSVDYDKPNQRACQGSDERRKLQNLPPVTAADAYSRKRNFAPQP
ncbi:pentapeptide repeat-containing protein [Paracoccus ravus]|uniref:pentapeptide repeat-containing protein n=1 Tax=Paracoccus ravus TaxID=2447760 RepID=UPI00106E23CE|nr:pentapeptide repeat-containing protein [Paracoccus ravus]